MHISGKQRITLGLVGGYVLAVIADPFITVARLNIEGWAQEKGYDKLYKLVANPPEWLVGLWEFITGPFGLGFTLGALLFAFWDPLARYGRQLFTTCSQAHQAVIEAVVIVPRF